MGGLGDWGTGELGDWETGRLGDWEHLFTIHNPPFTSHQPPATIHHPLSTRPNTHPGAGALTICTVEPLFFPNWGLVLESIDRVLTGGKSFTAVGTADGDENADFADL